MELPRRNRGDELLRAGELLQLRHRLRGITAKHDLVTVIACAFDHRTRMLPFIYADLYMAPAGVRAIGSVLVDIGCHKTRIVLQQWNRNFQPSRMQLDGRMPDVFMVSSLQIHSAGFRSMMRDVCRIDPKHRPLIIAGGPKINYEPWSAFSADAGDAWSADVAITGEEYVLLSLLEVVLSERVRNESIRSAFLRARNTGMLDDVPGLVFARTSREGRIDSLIDTGIQRLLGDLDELPHPVLGYRLLEPPGNGTTLAPNALPANRVRRHSPIGSLVMTFGCKFACAYCPIPAYNQRQYRVKSGERIADEFQRLHDDFGIRTYFSADDNFFNNKDRTLNIVEALVRTKIGGLPIRKRIRWGTEVTVHDTLQMRDHLSVVRKSGLCSLWLGVEDMTATLVNKGQSVGKTVEALQLLSRHGIAPMPMMMHHDEQPLVSRGPKPYGLLNQIKLMRNAGAVSMQVLMLVPATGSKLFAGSFTSGMAYESVGGRKVEEYMLGGGYVIASHHRKPWRKQLNMFVGYAYFYNPLRLLLALVKPKSRLYFMDAVWQVLGMWGLLQTVRRTIGWNLKLWRGAIVRRSAAPSSQFPMQSPDGANASHSLPATTYTQISKQERVFVASPGSSTSLPLLSHA